ncbi:MAG: ATP-binding cassette domain-containing protein [Pseudomonadota bacterium]
MTGPDPALQACELLVDYGAFRALDRVSLQRGAMTVLVGPNGSGKSSLLMALAGAVPAASGRIMLEGRALPDWPLRDVARHMALLP